MDTSSHGKSLSTDDSKRGLLLAGETGSGKTSGGLMKSCLFVAVSQIIHAPTTELFEYTAGFRATTDHIMVFAPTIPEASLGFNPMLRANTLSEVNRLSKLIITLFTSKKDNGSFWNIKAQELLTCAILVLKKCDSQYHTLPNVAERELTPQQQRFNERKRRLEKKRNQNRDLDRSRER